ncbi:MAG: insulinase family protein [Melioribacteraceae bacterium]|nr:insulinase family protein [Melioribacteraceae bacterium]
MKKIFLALLFTLSISAQTSVEDVKEIRLTNGMKIFVIEDHSIPNANMYLFWKVGSRNEYPGITGLSHFFEHMMFNGSKKYGPKMFDRVMEANGGANNAYTSQDVTVYTDWFPSSSLEVIFDLEADRIANLNFDDEMIESERGVVLSERSTGLENSNYQKLSEQVLSVAFSAHPYGWSVIGHESDIKNWTKQDLQNYFATYYAPNNCTVVICGDVNINEVERLAKKYFEPIKPNDPPREIHTVEPPQEGEKRVKVIKEVSSPNIMIVYHIPECKHPDYYSLDLLSSILSSGKSSRLYSSIINSSSAATNVFSYTDDSFDPSLFTVFSTASKGVSADSLESLILKEIDKIIAQGVTEKELQKVKNQKLIGFYRSMETINGRANTLGTFQLFYSDYKRMFSAPNDYKKVTVEDIKRVAEKYLTAKNRTIGILEGENE